MIVDDGQFAEILILGNKDALGLVSDAQYLAVSGVFRPRAGPFDIVSEFSQSTRRASPYT